MIDRKAQIVGSIDLATAKGLELGPLVNPVVPRGSGDIRYLDHVDTDALRARYSTHVGFDVDAIVPIDYAIGDGTISDAVGADAPFDYVVASHVIEHVPDLVRWLDDIRSVLRADGVLSLAIPDHRCCFDALRSPTVVADIVHAHLTGAEVPTPRQVFDHYFCAVAWHGLIAWGEEPPFDELVQVHGEQEALERATEVHVLWRVPGRALLGVHTTLVPPRRGCDATTRPGVVPPRVVHRHLRRRVLRGAAGHDARRRDGISRPGRRRPSVRAHRGCERDASDVQRQLVAVQTELDATIASRSWRITEPLRAFNAWRAGRHS